MNLFFTATRYTLVVYWLAFLVNLAMPFAAPWYNVMLYSGLILLGAHLLELVLVYKRLKQINRHTPMDIVWVLLIGLVHWIPLLQSSKVQGSKASEQP